MKCIKFGLTAFFISSLVSCTDFKFEPEKNTDKSEIDEITNKENELTEDYLQSATEAESEITNKEDELTKDYLQSMTDAESKVEGFIDDLFGKTDPKKVLDEKANIAESTIKDMITDSSSSKPTDVEEEPTMSEEPTNVEQPSEDSVSSPSADEPEKEQNDGEKTSEESDEVTAVAENEEVSESKEDETTEPVASDENVVADEKVETEVRLGIGYEDWTDYDYNDSVVCFVGKYSFNTETGEITSLVDQNVNIFVKRNSAGLQNISFSTLSVNEETENLIFDVSDLGRMEERSYSVTLKKGDMIKLRISNRGNNAVTTPFSENSDRIKLEKDVCKTKGF